ncbi:hypothetical protein I3760_08G092100 [Carya illinoinensis]|nr:hypothetical protein I3760_08G092100 [Carya illinoinensis]
MGNYVTYPTSEDATGKVILSDGTHSQQVVVELHSAVNEKWPTPLPADKMLETRRIYVIFHVKQGKLATLSSEETQRILLTTNLVLCSRSLLLSSSRFLPLFTQIFPAASLGSNGQGLLMQKESEERTEKSFVLMESLPKILDGRPDNLRRKLSGKGWKSSLDTIKENNIKKKMSHWLFKRLSFF